MQDIFSNGFGDTLLRFAICILVNWAIVHFLYFKKSKRQDFYFTFMVISVAIYFLVYLMMGMDRGKATMGVGLGLFGIFSIMRYRTDSMPVREMTYLFVVICLSVVHAMADSLGIDVNGRLSEYVVERAIGLHVQRPFPRMKWIDAMNDYGSDKPDTRFGMKLVEVTDLVKDCGFGVFAEAASKKGWSVRGINAKGQGGMGRKQIDKIVEMARGNGAKGLPYISLKEDGSVKCSFAKFVSEEEIKALVDRMGGEPGDLLFFAADKNGIVWNVLGALRLKLGEDLGLIDHNQFNFLWVVDFPLLEWSEEENRFVAMHHPFTMPVEEDWERIDSDPGSVRAKAYDIVLNGVELGGGSVRIHQSDIQEKMFEVIGLSKEEANEKFGFLLTAFKYGVPPHAGLAYGVDRFVMLLTGADSIREVIAFPKNKDAADLMSGAPDVVDPVQLTDLHIAVEKEAE